MNSCCRIWTNSFWSLFCVQSQQFCYFRHVFYCTIKLYQDMSYMVNQIQQYNKLYMQLKKSLEVCNKDADITNLQIKQVMKILINSMLPFYKNLPEQNQIDLKIMQKVSEPQTVLEEQVIKACQMNTLRIEQIKQQVKNLKTKLSEISFRQSRYQDMCESSKKTQEYESLSNLIKKKSQKYQRQISFILLKLGKLLKEPQIVPIPISAKSWVYEQSFHYKSINFLNENTVQLSKRGTIFCKNPIGHNQKQKYSIFLEKCSSAVYFGLADQSFSKLQYFPQNSRFFYYGSEGSYWDGTNSVDESGLQFGQLDTITMTVDTIEGEIQWKFGRYKSRKCSCLKLKQDKTALWVPYISTNTHVWIVFVE